MKNYLKVPGAVARDEFVVFDDASPTSTAVAIASVVALADARKEHVYRIPVWFPFSNMDPRFIAIGEAREALGPFS